MFPLAGDTASGERGSHRWCQGQTSNRIVTRDDAMPAPWEKRADSAVVDTRGVTGASCVGVVVGGACARNVHAMLAVFRARAYRNRNARSQRKCNIKGRQSRS